MPSALRNKIFSLRSYIRHFFLAKRSGHGVHSPFVYSLCEELFDNPNAFYEFDTLDQTYRQLLENRQRLRVQDFGAGSRHFKTATRKVSSIAWHGISSPKKYRLLFRLVNYFDSERIVELGTSLGLSAMSMALANSKAMVYSLEGDPALVAFARKLHQDKGLKNIEVMEGRFEEQLPALLQKLDKIDLAFIDGNHRKDATLNYFNLLLDHIHPQSVLVFDDIYWSEEMQEAWQQIKSHPKVKLSIDLFHFGLVFFREEILEVSEERLWF